MDDIVDFIFELLWMSWMEFRLFVGVIGAGVAISEWWPFDTDKATDKTMVMNTFVVSSMLLCGGIFVYRRFWKTP
ncbi:hypothetical protein [Tardiphaga sp.]|uniref:hypothetical protein n=1 Tax=Tardiphaga sp. TaxID=1926292 RepID=UPI0026359D49|nr:hypothetical protein [Tardiphaga sp.]MDB5616014.1 hypothetical protein [Tardiphaga sp.]